MRELVAHRSYAVDLTTTVQLRAAGISIYNNTVERLRRCYRRPRQCPFMWPDSILLVVCVGLAIAGIYYIHLVNLAVTIPVVVFIVYVFISHLASL